MEQLNINDLDLDTNVEDLGHEQSIPMNATSPYLGDFVTNPQVVQKAKGAGKQMLEYVTLFIIIFFISLLFLQKRLITLFFKNIIDLDKRIHVYISQALTISLLSTYSVYHLS